MYLFVDETECPEYFIVTGLLVNSKEDVELAYKRFKKRIKMIPMLPKLKAQLFTEFKSTVMDRTFQKIKTKMLNELNTIHHQVIYSCYIKKQTHFSQEEKEHVYIEMISRIIWAVSDDINVRFDRFNKPVFENSIVSKLSSFQNVVSAIPVDSQSETGIQFADNLCSVVRLYRTGKDENNFYDIIKLCLKEV